MDKNINFDDLNLEEINLLSDMINLVFDELDQCNINYQ
jgi:hypothetical protein